MQAIILAAGMGKRLKELTKNVTKCMVEVNGVTLIERTMRQLETLGLSKIVLVIGFEGQKLREYVEGLGIKTPVVFVHNEVYGRTNNIYSLYLARDYLVQDDTLLLESDIIFEPAVLRRLVDDPYPSLVLVDRYESWMDGTVVTLDEDGNILRFIGRTEFSYEDREQYYKTVNLYKFSREFSATHYVPFLEAYCKALGKNEYYEQVLKVITLLERPGIKAALLNGERWYEIDDIQDLDIAESLFAQGEEQLSQYQGRFGGYWRYPGILDFCYLVNPFFPPKRMLEEMRASFGTLLSNYPSGMEVNSLLASKCFGPRQDQIVVGNGASELIKALMERDPGGAVMAFPTFEEYPNRKKGKGEPVGCFISGKVGHSYDEADLIAFYERLSMDGQSLQKPGGTMILVNPDNPSGNYISREGVLRLAQWAGEQKLRLVVDESFGDFAEERDNTLLKPGILQAYPHMAVVKSISKSYGVPGLRLGLLASGDLDLVQKLKKEVAIWNINSFAEFFMQILEKYQEDYWRGMEKFRLCRRKLFEGLQGLQGLVPYPSQANYIMCRLTGKITARELTRRLLAEKQLFIKDLTGKPGLSDGQYVRLAVRRPEENERLLKALGQTLS